MILYLTSILSLSTANGLQCYNCVWLSNLDSFDRIIFPEEEINSTETCVRPNGTVLNSCQALESGKADHCSNTTFFLKSKAGSDYQGNFNLYFRNCQDSLLSTRFQQIQTKRSSFCVSQTLEEFLGEDVEEDSIWNNFEMTSPVEFCKCFSDGCNARYPSGNGSGGEKEKLTKLFYLISFIVFVLF